MIFWCQSLTKTSGNIGTFCHMITVAWVLRAASSCIDTVEVILSDCCDTMWPAVVKIVRVTVVTLQHCFE